MTVTLDEVLMGLGGFTADFDWDPDLARLLAPYRQLRVRWGEELIYAGVILHPDTARSGIRVEGRSLEWYLGGADDTGPLLVDREFVAGTNKLSNGDFALGDLYWSFAEGSYWVLVPGGVVHANPPPTVESLDDMLTSAESFEARPGELYAASADVTPGTTYGGRIRIRTVYEGRFATPDLAKPYTDWPASAVGDIADGADPLGVVTGPAFEISTAVGNRIPNGSFEDGLNGWLDGAGTWATGSSGPWGGSSYVATSDATGYKWLQSSSTGSMPVAAQNVLPGEEYVIRAMVRAQSGTDGEAWLNLGLTDAGFAVIAYEDTDHVKQDDASTTDWRVLEKTLTVPDGVFGVVPSLIVTGQTTGEWGFDGVSMVRTKGNVDTRSGPFFAVVPRRSYTWLLPFRSDPGVAGTVQMRLICYASDRPVVILQGPTLRQTDEGRQTVEWRFETPSGYDTIQQQLYSEDVAGGSYWVGQGSITDDDPSTYVRDQLVGPASSGTSTITSYGYVPAGAERLRVELIAEHLAGEWTVRNVTLNRVGVTPSSSGQVVHALLVDPVTGSQLLAPGDIVGPELIRFDWRIRNLTCRDAMIQLSRAGVALPVREWRTRPIEDAPGAAFDWGTADELFADRTDVVLARNDFFLASELRQSIDVEDAANVVRIIGAERVSPQGTRQVITGEATNDLAGAVDGNGTVLHRVSVVEDSTVDHAGYAAARARYEADARAGERSSLSVALNDWRAMGRFGVGDTLYFFDPEAGLSDPSVELSLPDGRAANPVAMRVSSRRWDLGGGPFRIEVRDPATGEVTEIDSRLVRWSDRTVATLEVGDLSPTFVSHGQGGAVGNQFLRFRASSPR